VTAASSASSSSASSESPPCAGPAIFLYSSQSASSAPNVSSPLPLSKAAVYGREAQGKYDDAASSTIEAMSCRNHLYETRVMLLCQREKKSQPARMFRVPMKGPWSLDNPIFCVQCMHFESGRMKEPIVLLKPFAPSTAAQAYCQQSHAFPLRCAEPFASARGPFSGDRSRPLPRFFRGTLQPPPLARLHPLDQRQALGAKGVHVALGVLPGEATSTKFTEAQ
jgi:hypothetical protein